MNSVVPLSNARIARNDVMYADDTGLVEVAAMVKKYVKAVFGADSPQFAQISGLEFHAPEIRNSKVKRRNSSAVYQNGGACF